MEANLDFFKGVAIKPYTTLLAESFQNFNAFVMFIMGYIMGSFSWIVINQFLTMLLSMLAESFRREHRMPIVGVIMNDLQKLFDLIEQHYKSHRSAKHYAQQLGISVNKLNKIANTGAGKNVEQLIMERLLEESERLLLTTDHPMKNIAYELGFSSHSNFTRFFKKYKNVSPTYFRRTMLESVNNWLQK